MKDETILLRIEPELKLKLRKISKKERRSMTSFILLLIEKSILEEENGRKE